MKRFLILALTLSLLIPGFVNANPGGVGSGNENMQCGTSCHGDASQNEQSPTQIAINTDAAAWQGVAITVTVELTSVTTSDENLVSVFLLTDTSKSDDQPQENGWRILSDPTGGTNNMVELNSASSSLSISWTLMPEQLGEHEFYAAIHHGGQSGSPYFGVSSAHQITVSEVPENLPRLSPDFTPPTSVEVGKEINIELDTIDTTSSTFEWRIKDGESINEGQIPVALQPTVIEWRAVLKGEGPDQTSAWFTLVITEPKPTLDQFSLYMQAFALLILGFALPTVLLMKKKSVEQKTFDQTALLEIPAPLSGPPLPATGLPPGWTMEQWEFYGQEYLDGGMQ